MGLKRIYKVVFLVRDNSIVETKYFQETSMDGALEKAKWIVENYYRSDAEIKSIEGCGYGLVEFNDEQK